MSSVIKAKATLRLKNGDILYGPITTEDNKTYLFVNKSSDLDAYFRLTKVNGHWEFAGGPTQPTLQEYIDQIGYQIDNPAD